MLEVSDLRYTYPGSQRPALEDVSFRIEKGEVFGFLGPNGAGKSTTQKILTGILQGYQGRVKVFGRDLGGLGPDYYNRIGVCFEFPNLYEKLTAEENLEFYRRFFGVPTEAPQDLLRMFNLPVGDKRTVGQFSKGMKMRLVLARSLLNKPSLWFLDEPTTGQDPQHSVKIREYVRDKKREGTTVFLTTHDMHVAEELCDRVAFIVDGRIVAVDAPRNLMVRGSRRSVRVEYRSGADRVSVEFDLDSPAGKAKFLETVRANDVETIHTLEPSLEDVFIKVTGRRLADK